MRRIMNEAPPLRETDRRVRYRIYRSFVETAEPPAVSDLADTLGLHPSGVEDSLRRLAEARAIVLTPGTAVVWMAHPFSAVPTDYPVLTARGRYWANCAWDALAIPPLLDCDGRIETRCSDCGEPLVSSISAGRLETEAEVVHFLVPARRFWEDIGFT